MVTGPGPYYAPSAELDRERAHRDFDNHLWLAIEVARNSVGVHIMTNTALDGATYDIDGGEQLVPA